MIRRINKRFTRSTAKLWLAMGGLLGVGMLPCPECGTPMIFHIWPLAGIAVVVRMLKKRYPKKGKDGSEAAPDEPGTQISISQQEDHGV